MHSLSRLGAYANERVAELDRELIDPFDATNLPTSAPAATASSAGAGANRICTGAIGATAACQNYVAEMRSFDAIVSGIDRALGVDHSKVRQLRWDEVLVEWMPVRATLHYKVCLPTRPSVVTVSVVRISGAAPTLWGSTTCERPNAKNHQLRGKDEKIVYEHALSCDTMDEENGLADRRSCVPSCRELFVTVESELGCQCRTSAHVGHLKIVLTRKEISSQVKKIRRGWEARIGELRREPAMREVFDEHVNQLSMNKRHERYGGRDFLEEHSRSLQDHAPRDKIKRLQMKAITRCEREDMVRKRRENKALELDLNKSEWLSRRDAWKLMREEEDHRRELQEEAMGAQRAWLVRLAVVGFLNASRKASQEIVAFREAISAKVASACVITQFVMRALSRRRRNLLYMNVFRLRTALIAYTRVVQPVVAARMQPVIRAFLEQYAFHREAPTLTGALQRFRGRVVQIQRWVRQLKMIRNAYITLFMSIWDTLQDAQYKQLAADMAEKDVAVSQTEHTAMKAFRDLEASLGSKSKGGRRRSSVNGMKEQTKESSRKSKHLARRDSSLRLDTDMRQSLTTRAKTIESTLLVDPVPRYLIKAVLNDYIREMMYSHKRRVAEWQSMQKRAEYLKDLEGFGVHDQREHRHEACFNSARPLVVYIDKAELEVVVRETVARWGEGEFKHVRANRKRIMEKPFRAWVRASKHGGWTLEPDDGCGEQPAPAAAGGGQQGRRASREGSCATLAVAEDHKRRTEKRPTHSSKLSLGFCMPMTSTKREAMELRQESKETAAVLECVHKSPSMGSAD